MSILRKYLKISKGRLCILNKGPVTGNQTSGISCRVRLWGQTSGVRARGQSLSESAVESGFGARLRESAVK